MLWLHQNMGGTKGHATHDASSESPRLRMDQVEYAMALRTARTLSQLSSPSTRAFAESAAIRIGLITFGAKLAGQRSAGNPPAPLDEAGTGNGGDGPLERDTHPKGEKQPGLARPTHSPRQSSTLPLGSPVFMRERGVLKGVAE